MIPEIGHFLLWLALGVSLALGVVPLVGRIELGELRRARQRPPARHEGRFRAAAVGGAYRQFPIAVIGLTALSCPIPRPVARASQ